MNIEGTSSEADSKEKYSVKVDESLKTLKETQVASWVLKRVEEGKANFACRPQTFVRGRSPERRGCQGANACRGAGEGAGRHIGRGCRSQEARLSSQVLSACSHPQEGQQAKTQCPAGLCQTLAQRRWAQTRRPSRCLPRSSADAMLKAKMAAPRMPAARSP